MRRDSHKKRAGYRDKADPSQVKLQVTTVARDEYERPAWVDRAIALLGRLRRKRPPSEARER
ncbi:MAG: hypothetical protein AB8I08_00405 [Sandaracinaceae bacterium]